jgi:hypothetical protein
LTAAPQTSTHLDARDIWQHDVEHQQIGLASLDFRKRSRTIMHDHDVVAGAAEVERHQLGQIYLVLYD